MGCMAPERTVKTSLPTKEIKPVMEPPIIQPETAVKAAEVAEHIAEGKTPGSQEISDMVRSLASDLKAQGIHISSDDIREVEKQIREGNLIPVVYSDMKPDMKQPVRLKDLPDIDLKEYQKVMDGFVRNYGLDKGAWNTISGILIASELTGQALWSASRAMIGSGEGFTNLSKEFGKISEKLKLKDKNFGELWNSLWKRNEKRNYSKADLMEVGKIALKAAWPIPLGWIHWFAERKARTFAGKLYMSERARLQEAVNNRIADSLYMRNFEFLHNESSGEMMQVINNGKDATVDLVSAIHEELIPLKWSQWSSIGSQFLFNSYLSKRIKQPEITIKDMPKLFMDYADSLSSLVKKLTLDTRTKLNARKIQKQRADELAQWDKVNTKLLSTLQGLETIRTVGNAEAGSDVLYESLAARDFVEAGGLREKRIQDQKLNTIFDYMDLGVFGVKGFVDTREFAKSGAPNAEDVLKYASGQLFQARDSMAAQQGLRQSFFTLTHLYADRIIPDIQDIKRMEELLGPYDELDHPMGLRERARIPVSQVSNFDISVKDLRFKNILHGVSLDIPQGSFVTIKGPSGIGKSTLFRHLVGLYQGDAGSVRYGSVEIDGIKKYGPESLYTKIAYANQSPQYFEDMTLRENLLLWTPKQVPQERIESVLKDLKLDQLLDRLDTKSKHFSGGEMRRIGIARALLKDPKVLFLDEPTANLDAVSTRQVMNIIQELRKKRPDMTVVAITHDPVFEKIAEKIVDFEKLNKKPPSTILKDNQVFEAKAKP